MKSKLIFISLLMSYSSLAFSEVYCETVVNGGMTELNCHCLSGCDIDQFASTCRLLGGAFNNPPGSSFYPSCHWKW